VRLRIGLPEIISIGLVAALFIVLLAQVILRPFGLGFVWAEEFAAFAFITLVFFGTAVAHRRGEHMVVEAFEEWAAPKLSPRQRLIWVIAILVLELAFMMLLAIGIAQMVVQSWNQFAGSLSGFRYGWLFAAVLAAVLMSIAAVAAQLFTKLLLLRGDAR
jgi:TRAP-type C4-dicarboxylate transport system permease small subunit